MRIGKRRMFLLLVSMAGIASGLQAEDRRPATELKSSRHAVFESDRDLLLREIGLEEIRPLALRSFNSDGIATKHPDPVLMKLLQAADRSKVSAPAASVPPPPRKESRRP